MFRRRCYTDNISYCPVAAYHVHRRASLAGLLRKALKNASRNQGEKSLYAKGTRAHRKRRDFHAPVCLVVVDGMARGDWRVSWLDEAACDGIAVRGNAGGDGCCAARAAWSNDHAGDIDRRRAGGWQRQRHQLLLGSRHRYADEP